jgi:predicted ATP-grasp superfamily ATP-dependent carboligase
MEEPHFLFLAGVGGMSPPEGVRSAVSVTPRTTVIHVTAWGQHDPVDARRLVTGLGGEWIDAPDPDSAVAAARQVHARRPVDGAATHSELLLATLARITSALGLRGNPPEVVEVAQSKLLQRQALAAAGLPVPRFHPVRGEHDLRAAGEAVGYPAVLKPVLGAASIGVVRVGSPVELAEAWRRTSAARTPFLEPSGGFVLEQELQGAPATPGEADYCSVESIVRDCAVHHLAIVDRLPLRHGFVEEGLVYPSVLPDAMRAAVEACASYAIAAIGLTDCAVHTEVKLTPDGPVCIEVNARLGGPVGHLLRLASDNDIAATIARAALGLPFPTRANPTGAACVRFVPAPEGRFRLEQAVEPADLVARHAGLVYVKYRAPVGGVLDGTFPHVASFLVQGRDRSEVLATVAAVDADLDYELTPVTPARSVA